MPDNAPPAAATDQKYYLQLDHDELLAIITAISTVIPTDDLIEAFEANLTALEAVKRLGENRLEGLANRLDELHKQMHSCEPGRYDN